MSGRGRLRRDYPPRSEEKTYHGRSNAPPSRHLWVGNLPLDINEIVLANHFLRFGEIEDIAFQPGRSYAFVNFKYDEEAFAAVSALQGFDIGGNRIKIEFAKADRSSSLPRDEDFPRRRDEQRSETRERDMRMQHLSPDHQGKRKMSSDKDGEPSEVLWIGFPAQLRVDEEILRKAFSPFGEIERITVFQGRTYAFVRYKDIRSACIAKDTLQGRLFGNPRVHICFAKNESGSSRRDSQDFDPYGRSGFPEDFRHERNYNHELDDPDMGFRRNSGFDQRRFQPHFHDMPPHRFPQSRMSNNEDDWDLPEDNLLFHGNKKPKTTSFLPESELPEFRIPGFDQGKHVFPRNSPDFHRLDHGKNSEPGPYGYKQGPDRVMNPNPPYGERSDHWGSSYDRFESGPGLLPPSHLERSKLKPEQRLSEEWKWEGTIAKGGTPVCRARCFPKGKVLDMPLPEFLDCTARTGLDMLAKHYYQATSTWVVFFVPESDSDIVFYNEFMHYLEEKQRAAVSKLDDRTTLFLVPPSEFSEKVLKIPGKLSISGVILRLENSGPQNPHLEEPRLMNYQGDTSSYPKPRSPPRQYAGGVSDYTFGKNGAPQQGAIKYGFDPPIQGYNPNSSSSGTLSALQLNTFGKNGAPQGSSNPGFDPPIQGYNPTSSSSGTLSALQPEQLAQLASSLLGQQKQSSSMTGHSGTSYQQPQRHVFENSTNSNLGNSEFGGSQFGQARLAEGAQGGQSATSDEDQDPQKRLQATLQLAAALLQQIQQTKGN